MSENEWTMHTAAHSANKKWIKANQGNRKNNITNQSKGNIMPTCVCRVYVSMYAENWASVTVVAQLTEKNVFDFGEAKETTTTTSKIEGNAT